jgi:hypothetical protein
VLAYTTVDVQASYLDRIAIIAGIVLVLGGLLTYIIRRVRTAETGDELEVDASSDADSQSGRYTEGECDEYGGPDAT